MNLTKTETIGLFGRPAAPPLLDQESPEFVKINRWRGYPEDPFDRACRRYLPGASSVGKPLDDNGAMLKNWAAKITREVAADLRQTTATMTKAETMSQIKAEADARMDRSRLIGTDVHLVTALEDAGRGFDRAAILGKWEGAADNLITAWHLFKEDVAPRFGAIERTGYTGPLADGDPETKVAGTIDRLAVLNNPPASAELNIRPGIDLVVLDIKTKVGKSITRVEPMYSNKVQAHALGLVERIAFEAERDMQPLPSPIKAAALVYLCEDGYVAYWDHVGQPFNRKMVANCARMWHVERNIHAGHFGTSTVGYLTPQNQAPTFIDLTQKNAPSNAAPESPMGATPASSQATAVDEPSVGDVPASSQATAVDEPSVGATQAPEPELEPDPKPEPVKAKRTRSTTKKPAAKKPAAKSARTSKPADGPTQEPDAATAAKQ